MTSTRADRGAYHHGDLANALTRAATDLARAGGPEAVVLREAARQVGVSATAAYRHFAGHGDLIHAVKMDALGTLADAIAANIAALPPVSDPIEDGYRRLAVMGTSYVTFALDEPGLFRTAFCHSEPKSEGDSGNPADTRPYQYVTQVLDDLVAAGGLDPARREFAEVVVWSAVHGLSLLLLDGPLAVLPPEARQTVIDRTIAFVHAGLAAPAR